MLAAQQGHSDQITATRNALSRLSFTMIHAAGARQLCRSHNLGIDDQSPRHPGYPLTRRAYAGLGGQ